MRQHSVHEMIAIEDTTYKKGTYINPYEDTLQLSLQKNYEKIVDILTEVN